MMGSSAAFGGLRDMPRSDAVLRLCCAVGVITICSSTLPPLVSKAVRGARRFHGSVVSRRIAKAKRTELAAQLAAAQQWLKLQPPLDAKLAEEITTKPTSELVAAQVAGKLTAIQLLTAFLSRALAAHDKSNCLVWADVAQAAAMATAADEHLKKHRKPLGPLHGVPVSVKECMALAGTDCTAGMTGRCFQPLKEDSVGVAQLRSAGAVFYVKTNVPQTMVSFECLNYVFGPGLNPHHPAYTCGGSTGGEGALLALGGSPVGFGGDIGGSLRTPAHFCGVFGFKPTTGRVPAFGNPPIIRGQESVQNVFGPMGRSVDDLVAMFKALLQGSRGIDGGACGVEFRQARFDAFAKRDGKRRFGYYVDDGFVPASPACRRAVEETVERLRAAGHTCVPLRLIPGKEVDAVVLFYRLMTADGGKNLKDAVGFEPLIPHIANPIRISELPAALRYAIAAVIRTVGGDATLSRIFQSIRESRVDELWALHTERQLLRQIAANSMNHAEVDAVLTPALVFPAVPHGASADASMGCLYPALFNLLDLPATTIPATAVDRTKDAWERKAPHGVVSPIVENRIRAAYDADAQHGLPVGVQLVGRRFDDEALLGLSDVVAKALRPMK